MNQITPYQVGEAARQAEVSLRTVRFYEQKGLIIPSVRTSNNMRLYSESDINRIRLIRRLRNTGMSLKQIEVVLNPKDDGDRKAKVEYTIKVLNIEADNTRKRIAALEYQDQERQEIIRLIRKCLSCERDGCPEKCPPRAHIIH